MPDKSLRNKSIANIKAADLLVEQGFFDSSAHCSYYGCLQLIRIAIFRAENIDFVNQRSESKSYQLGSHVYYYDKFLSVMSRNFSRFEFQPYIRNFKKIKELRVCADYDSENAKSGECRNAVVLAQEFSDYVMKKFKI